MLLKFPDLLKNHEGNCELYQKLIENGKCGVCKKSFDTRQELNMGIGHNHNIEHYRVSQPTNTYLLAIFIMILIWQYFFFILALLAFDFEVPTFLYCDCVQCAYSMLALFRMIYCTRHTSHFESISDKTHSCPHGSLEVRKF